MSKISIDNICAEDYLPQELTEHYMYHPSQKSGFDVKAIERLAINIQSGGEVDIPRVYQEGKIYRVHVDDRELVSAQHYVGMTSIPVQIMNPSDLDVPAYLRKNGPLKLDEDGKCNLI
ncbi:MAG: hypothetical protein CMH61_02060 [Nanoarchaeota archaeon]|nr:hypothetical protein [Nanoarchaeota archaeon]|tara:strand:- start:2021 stop:2374 length:354 start_codon:yes stop_codon:yes gene_type:complete